MIAQKHILHPVDQHFDDKPLNLESMIGSKFKFLMSFSNKNQKGRIIEHNLKKLLLTDDYSSF